jgi:hypothetical protein
MTAPRDLWRFFGSCIFVAASALAQTSTGQLSVTILDSSAAVVPAATVQLVGSDTGNILRTVETNASGTAAIPLIPPGNYNLSVTHAGFKTAVRRKVTVNVGSVADLTITLETGNANESVTITSDAPLVEDKSATVAQVITSQQLIDLPLNGRNYLSLANLTAGAIPSSGSRDQTFSAYGNTGLQNAFLLDGGRNENYLRGLDNRARDIIRPPLDALSEFSVQTSNFSAEYGSSAGAVVSAITKSGTNSFHGSAYDFLRNDHLDAINYFAQRRPLLVRNQYGGSLGGPIRRDRAWFFAAYEGTPNRSESTASSTVPTQAQRSGNFTSTPVFDPATTRLNPNGTGYIRDQFQNNVIPASRLNALGVNLLNSYPLANAPGSSTLFVANTPQLQNSNNAVLRGDVQVSSKDSMFGRYSISRGSLFASPGLPLPAQTPVARDTDSTSFAYGYTRTLSPTFINEFRFTWTTINLQQDATQALNPIIPGSLDPQVMSGTPFFNLSGYAGLGSQPSCCSNSPLRKSSGVWDWSDNLSKSLGAHVLKFGGEFILIRPSTFATSNGRANIGFTGVFSQNPQTRAGTGSPVADLLLGYANSLTTGTIANSVERSWFVAGYLQDQWTVNRQLTLNFGVRFEYAAPYTEINNRMANLILDAGDPLYGKLIQAGNAARPDSLIYGNKNNWAPRAGLAWRVPHAKDLVIRSAFGLFYAQDQGTGVTNRLTSNPPFFGYGAQTLSSDQLFPATGFVLSPNASIVRPAPIDPATFRLVPSATSTLVSWPSHLRTPYVAQWSFAVEKRLPWNMVAEVNYVGNHGVGLLGVGEANQPIVLAATTVNSRRPLAQYTIASVKAVRNWNASYYEGMSAKLEKRFQSGVSFLTTFTYGHALDLQNPALDLCDGCGSGDTIQNNYNLSANRASADNDVRLRYVFGGSLESPFGTGKRWLASSRAASAVLGGWRGTTIYQVQTGLPFTPGLSFDAANGGTVTRPNRVCDGNIDNPTLQRWFDTSCFTVPTSLMFGNSGRNVLRAPGRNNVDFSLQRDFRMPTERATILQIRLEAFNALNHPQFGTPGATVGNAQYGLISGTGGENRQLQIGMRVTF